MGILGSTPLFLGLDCSTQSLSCVVVNAKLQIQYEGAVNFDADLPSYNTTHGCLDMGAPQLKHSSPLLWVEALDMLLSKIQKEGPLLSSIVAVCGAAQQHGSVYLSRQGVERLSSLDPAVSLKDNLAGGFSRATAPIWMDTSTTSACGDIRHAAGGVHRLVEMTGSDLFERFTGPQIRKFFLEDPSAYAATDKVMLVSSFLASLFAGKIAPIDYGDGAGMGLMDIRSKRWLPELLNATAPHLAARLPPLDPAGATIGTISPYFVKRYGFSPKALALVWTGDNPSSLLGLGVTDASTAAISLGTSFTYFGYSKDCRLDYSGQGHLFVAPTGDYMPIVCFKNGALALEQVKSLYGLDWDTFNRALMASPPGNDGRLLLPYFEPEIVPHIAKAGVRRLGLDENDIFGNCRGVIEAQMLSMKLHSCWMDTHPQEIYATGGCSANTNILQIMADIFGVPVRRIDIVKSTALGAAMLAVHRYAQTNGIVCSWEDLARRVHAGSVKPPVMPIEQHVRMYEPLLESFQAFESHAKR